MIDSKLKHDILNEINKLKQIVQLFSEDDIPFSLEELESDGLVTLEKLQQQWKGLSSNNSKIKKQK